MPKRFWFAVCVFSLLALAAGCSRDTATPTQALPDSAVFADASVDPSLSAAAGQASLPGLTLEPASTFSGSVSPTSTCAYDTASGRVVCTPIVREGLTYTRSYAFYDAAGKPQPQRNADTRSMNTQVTVKGTRKTQKGSADIDRSSDLTVSGLGKGAATHTMNGSEHGTTTSSYTIYWGTVTAKETFDAATKDVVVPAEGKTRWPLSGTTSRASTTVATLENGPTRTSSSSETVTYNGTSIVDVVIVRNGVTRSCKKDLSTGKLACP